MSINANFDEMTDAYVAPYAPRGRQNKRGYLKQWAVWATNEGIEPTTLDRITLDRYKGFLIDKGGMPRSINSHLGVLRSFCRWMVEERIVERDPSLYLKNLSHPQQVTLDWLTDEQIAGLLDYVDANADPVMRGLVYVLVHHGSRPQETRLINQGDIDLNAGKLVFRHRKTGGSDTHTMPEIVVDALRPLVSQDDSEPLFVNENTGARISKTVVQKRFNELIIGAGVPKITQYGLRASFATNALAAGVPLRDVMYAMGHCSPAQTEKYDQRRHVRASIAQREAAERISLLRVA